jgi:hypothetical protein
VSVRNRAALPNYTHPLVGRGCHWLDKDGRVTWQGWVIADLRDGYFLIQLAEWLAGEGTQQVVVHLSEMALKATTGYAIKGGIVFYSDPEEMNAYYNAVLSKIPKPGGGK